MRRVLYVLAIGIVVITLAWAVASLPGRVTANFGKTTIETTTPVAVVAIGILAAVAAMVFRFLWALLRLPRMNARWSEARHRRHGDIAVTRTLVALAAGEATDAHQAATRARRLLGDTPQTLLLSAEAGRLAGRHEEADSALRQLAARSDAAFLGYRGLLRGALERQNWTEAAELARNAERVHPGGVRREKERLAIRTGRWSEAIELANDDPARAALGAAASEAEPEPAKAIKLARRAWKADPSLTAAAIAYASRLRANNRESRAMAVIHRAWAVTPHPDLATFALAPIAQGLDRARAAQRLTESNSEHSESRLLLIRTALDAGLTGEARHQADLARQAGLNERRLWLLIAEAAGADEANQPDWPTQTEALRRAAAADPDPEWRCENCQEPYPTWQPACARCGVVGSLRWLPGRPLAYPVPTVIAG